eukprot:2326354-Prymnesium_polylepis.1
MSMAVAPPNAGAVVVQGMFVDGLTDDADHASLAPSAEPPAGEQARRVHGERALRKARGEERHTLGTPTSECMIGRCGAARERATHRQLDCPELLQVFWSIGKGTYSSVREALNKSGLTPSRLAPSRATPNAPMSIA